jgi:hypothetical protein
LWQVEIEKLSLYPGRRKKLLEEELAPGGFSGLRAGSRTSGTFAVA